MANQDPHLSYRELAEQLLLPYGKKINPTIKQYRDILNKGLPGKASEKKKIIVVGAGIAGMLAAKLLSFLDGHVPQSRAIRRLSGHGLCRQGRP